MKFIRKVFSLVLFVQLVMFLIFITLNFNSLSNIPIEIDLTDYRSIGLSSFSFNMNFYFVLTIVGGITAIAIVFSINILDSGLNDFGSSTVAKYIYYTTSFIVLEVPFIIYIIPIGILGFIINLIVGVIWVFYFLEILKGRDEE